MAAQQTGEFTHVLPFFTALDRLLHLSSAFGTQDNRRELPEFLADFGFGEGLVEVAPMTVPPACRLLAVGQGHRNARRPLPRRDRCHSWVFNDVDAVP